MLVILALLIGCGSDPLTPPVPPTPPDDEEPAIELPDPLDALPIPASVTTDRFTTHDACSQCHTAAEGDDAMRDAASRDVSPVRLWRGSMMALAARDPYYLAVFSHELEQRPNAATTVERTCTRCHAPAASLEHEQHGGHVSFEDLTAGDHAEANLARDGVTCSMCHQIADDNLGDSDSFTGGFEVGFDRELFGPHQGVNTDPMQFFVDYTPSYGAHMLESSLCATCHTVIVRPLDEDGIPTGAEVVEQAPYLEWLSSSYQDTPCVSCHMPTTDDEGTPISTAIARPPVPVFPRTPYGRHSLVGGNAYMLRLMAANDDWANTGVPAEDLEASASAAEHHLRGAAELSVVSRQRGGDELVVVVRVDNLTGHKLPTGYPTRRLWIHLAASSGGDTFFESGGHRDGAIVGLDGTRLDIAGAILPHLDEINSSNQAQIYESVLVDEEGAPTFAALDAHSYAKDNRILPLGWSPSHPAAQSIAPVGVDDASFTGGADEVTYRFTAPNGSITLDVELLYQTIPPATIEAVSQVPTAAAQRFAHMTRDAAPLPIRIASATIAIP